MNKVQKSVIETRRLAEDMLKDAEPGSLLALQLRSAIYNLSLAEKVFNMKITSTKKPKTR